MATSIDVPRIRFTIDQYHRIGEAGVLGSDERYELLNGEVISITPIGHRHAACVNSNAYRFTLAFPGRAIVSTQNPLVLGRFTELQPDIALLRWRDDFYRNALPTAEDALLVLEAGDTSVELDRHAKAPLYAAASVAELWLVNLRDHHVEVCRQPIGEEYRSVEQYELGERVGCLAFPHVSWTVDEVLGQT
jgi:Uma2 family endonuclease